MTENPTPFDAKSGLDNFNKFFELPENKRNIALTVLEKIGKRGLPTGLQQLQAKDLGDNAQQAIERTYSEAADIFAFAIDSTFRRREGKKDSNPNNVETENLRALFYIMIRGCCAEQVLTGVEEIKRLSLAEAPPQTLDPQIVETVRKGLLRLMNEEDEKLRNLEDPTSHAEGNRIREESYQGQADLFEQAGMDYKLFYRAMITQGQIERKKLGNGVLVTESQSIIFFFRGNRWLPGFSWKL